MMRIRSKYLSIAAAAVAAASAVSCDDPVQPATTGSIVPQILFVKPVPGTEPSALLTPTTVRVSLTGPMSGGTVLVPDATNTFYVGRISGLKPGDYVMTLEGLNNSQVHYYARDPVVSVTRGASTQTQVNLTPAISTIPPPTLPNTSNFSQTVPLGAVAGATGYLVEWSQSPTFGSGVSSLNVTAASAVISVNAIGRWYVRTRATLPGTASTVPFSDSVFFDVFEASRGTGTAATAIPISPIAPDTVRDRNITPLAREDWFAIAVRAGDTLVLETRAARLNPVSPLNTILTVFENDATTQIATDDNGTGTNDSRIRTAVAVNDSVKVRVSAPLGSSGHYELTREIRRLPAAPTVLTATVLSGTRADLAWTDNADNESQFVIERCIGAACASFDSVGVTLSGVTTYVNDTLTQGLDYRWRVRARNSVGNSAPTNIASASMSGPSAPSNLVATTIAATQITLEWDDNSNNELGFIIERCTGAACTNFAPRDTAPADDDSYDDLTVVFGTAYRYQVRATNSVVASAPSDTADANTFPPATPSDLVAVVAGATQINLSWTDNASDELGFYVERCLGDACVNFQPIDTLPANAGGMNDNSVAFNTGYRYRVRAFHAVTGVAYTNISNADTRPPATPTGLTATLVGANEIELSWSDLADDEVSYVVERCSTAACVNFAPIDTLASNSFSYSDLSVVVDSVYRYRVYARGVPGNSAVSNVGEANLLSPEAPTGLTATTIYAELIRLAWTDNTNRELSFYIYRCTGGGCTPTNILAIADLDAQTYDDSTVVSGESYTYRVFAVNLAAASPPSNDASANTLAPATPTTLTATTVSGSAIRLDWTNNAPDATTMRIERCVGVGCSAFTEIDVIAASDTTYLNIGSSFPVTIDSVYTYRIRAQNAADVSAYSDTAIAHTLLASAPTSFAALVQGENAIYLAWGASTPDVTGYVIDRCVGSTCTAMTLLDGVPFAALEYTDVSVTLNNDYRYVVRGINAVGPGYVSDTLSANTRAPGGPANLVATPMPGIVRLTWLDLAQNELSTVIQRCAGAACVLADFVTIPTVDLETWDDSSVVANTEYTYLVRVENNVGASPPSNEWYANTLIADQVTVLTATGVSPTQVNLAWDPSASQGTGLIEAYNVYRCTGACDPATTGTLIVALGGGASGHADVSADPETDYTYAVVPRTAFGETAITGSAYAAANTRLPAAPNGLVATLLSPTSIQLDWNDNSNNETSFEVAQCAGVACTTLTSVASTGTGVTTYLADTLTFNVRYRFVVRAVNAVGASAATDTLAAGTTVPAVPLNLAAYITDIGSNLQLRWTDASTDETGYSIEYCVVAVTCDTYSEIATASTNDTLHDLGNASAAGFRFRIIAFNNAGASDPSNIVEINGDVPYAAPTGTIATTAGPTSIVLTWSDQTNNENAFEILRCTGGGCDPLAGILVDSVPRDSTTFVDNTVSVGQLYRYIVTATNGVGSTPSIAFDGHTMPADAPGVLSATALSNSEIALAWSDGGPFETGYVIERCTTPACGSFAPIDTVPANFVSYNDAGLSPNVTYRYRVQAINAVAASAYSNVAEKVTDLPAAPSTLGALAMTGTRIDLAWTDNADNEQFYIVERCAGTCDANGTYLEIETELAPNAEVYADNSVSAGQTYSYRVRALNAGGVSPYTNIATATTAVPTSPSDLIVTTLSGTLIDLTWTDNATNEISYQIERCASAACPTFTLRQTLAAGTTAYVDTVLVDDQYTYRVRAVNNVGASGYTFEETANTFLPAGASDFNVGTVSGTRIDLSWTDNATNEDGYVLERCSGPGCSDFALLDSLSPDASGYQNDGIATQTSFSYRVYAYNLAGQSVIAGPGTATTITPAGPTALSALLAAPGQIDLSWTDNADNEIQYRVERCSAGTTKCATSDSMNVYAVEVATLAPGSVFHSDIGLAPATTYFYRVRATNTAGSSPYSGIVSRSTNVPPAPTSLAAVTLLATRIDLTWTDASGSEDGFRVERCIGPDPCLVFSQIVELPAGTTSHADSSLSEGQEAWYRVLSFNGGGGNASNTATANTNVPAAPSDLLAQPFLLEAVNVFWTDNSSDEAGFYVERCEGLDCVNFTVLDTSAVDMQGFSDTSATPGNIYRYRVRAFGNGHSAYTAIASAATVGPNAASDLVATAISDTRIDLTWTDNTPTDSLWNEAEFLVFRCAGVACTPVAIHASVGRDTTFFIDSLLTPGETYSYHIVADNAAAGATPSNVATAATTVPAVPTALTDSTVSATEVMLMWADNANNETGYEIERCEGGGCSDYAPVDTAAADEQSIVIGGLSGAAAYQFRVRAFNAGGNSGYSNVVLARSDVPAAPTALTGETVSASQINLSWNDNAENETAYIVERCDGTGCAGFVAIDSLAADVTSYQDLTIAIDTLYTYRVRASNAAGPSAAYTDEVAVSTYRPATPTDLVATAFSATRVDLTWTDVAVNDTVIIVERCLGFGCSVFTDIDSLAPDAIAYSDLTVTVGNTYNYRLRAENAAGASASTDSVEVGTFIPSDPSGLSANTNSPTLISLNWVDASTTELDFLIERCVGLGCSSFDSLFVVGAGVTNYADTSVTLGNSYTYQVIARGGGGNSTPSGAATAHTFPAGDVTSLTAAPLTATTLQLSWSAADFAALYQIATVTGIDTTHFVFVNAATTDTVVTVPTGQVYNFIVRASNFSGGGAAAGAVIAMTPPPAPVNFLAFPLSTSQASLAWTDTSARETGFEVERAFFSLGSFGPYVTVATPGANVTGGVNTVDTPTGRYKYRVRAVNQIGAGAYSNEVDLTLTGPTAPSGLAAIVTAPGRITLNWTDNSDSEQSFSIERSVGDNLNFSQLATVGPGVVSHVDSSGIAINTSYFYRVRAVNNIGASGYTNESNTATTVPSIVAAIGSVIQSSTSIQLAWNGLATTGELGWRIYRCQGVGCTDFTLLDGSLPPDANTYTDVAASYGVQFRYQARPYNIAGEPTGNPINDRLLFLPTPSGVVALPDSRTSMRFLWNNPPLMTWETGFEVEQCAGLSCLDFTPLVTMGVDDTLTTSPGLPADGAWHRYRVRAIADGNVGNWSAIATSHTPKELTLGDTLVTVPPAEGGGAFGFMTHYVVAMPAGSPSVEVTIGDDPLGSTTNTATALLVQRGTPIQRSANLIYFLGQSGDTLCAPGVFTVSGGAPSTCSLPHLGVTTDYYITTYSNPYNNLRISVLPGPTTYSFNTCAQAGRVGPAQGQCDAAYTGTSLQGLVAVADSGVQDWTVPFSGRWAVTAVGASGASAAVGFLGGRGAQIQGEFELTQGQVLRLAVGQMGSGVGSFGNGGGGGGSFVFDVTGATPMLIAGGGGGTRTAAAQNGCDASTTAFAVSGSGSSFTSPCTVKAGGVGEGGIPSEESWGSGGAGFNSNGTDDSFYGQGGRSWAAFLTGGNDLSCGAGLGGFGGGGSGGGCNGGGGGGGYSGGDGGWIAGGGGSFNAGTNKTVVAGVGTAHGTIVLKYLGPVTP